MKCADVTANCTGTKMKKKQRKLLNAIDRKHHLPKGTTALLKEKWYNNIQKETK